MEAGKINKNPVIFFVLAFVISWLLWLPQLLTSNNLVQLPG